METLKEALKKKHVGTEQEISLLFLEDLKGFFFFFSKLGAKRVNQTLAHRGSQQGVQCCPEVWFLWIFDCESACFNVGLMGHGKLLPFEGECKSIVSQQHSAPRAGHCSLFPSK